MIKTIFKIDQLICGYKQGPPVLRVKDLVIPSGQLIFVVGVSGSGKSTFVETLGMMNNTIQAGSELSFDTGTTETVDLSGLWQQKPEVLDRFRKDYFSFIFQQTNLMPNFTCGENMVLTALLKGKTYEDAKKTVLEYMEILGLPIEIFDKRVTEVSGGQRQRIAFIRAIAGDFTVLFGDEPTGNLDPKTARELMSVLKNMLKARMRTGIVVSHDIDLAISFADMIIPITLEEDGDNRAGGIYPTQILTRNDAQAWMINGKGLDDPKQYLLSLFDRQQNVKTT